MPVLLVVENPREWTLTIPGTEIVPAREYLTDRRFVEMRRAKVFNLCRTYAYQSVGYYVSLLAAARGHRPLPSVTTVQDLRQSAVIRIVSEGVEALVQRALADIEAERFEVSIYFGRNLAQRYDRLCQALFDYFPVPLMRAEFVRADQWRLQSLRPIAFDDIPDSHHEFVIARAQRFFTRPSAPTPKPGRYDLAILVDPNEVDAPSNERAIQRFVRAAEKLGMEAWTIGRDDFGRVAEYDALFIRETTYVNHHTYRFARRAEAEGLVVIDDPVSIERCTNKVYQAEIFERHGIDHPRTLVVHRDNRAEVGAALGFPCVLKRPDSSFSAGVVKARDEAELGHHLDDFFRKSELVVAQEFVPSSFDWRVGVLDGCPLYGCKYHMARGHWQIQQVRDENRRHYGKVDTVAIADVPAAAVDLAVRAAALIGDGLYGVDIKETEDRFLVIEVNDNPNIEAGYEDEVLKDELYLAVMRTFLARLERRGRHEERSGRERRAGTAPI
ncbi:MAG: RimK family alpha-L-glutamate ligase [Myxococcales bacterium]|nr:MAG: RimK family alpha-L-glutamate ligase [Myxococcales bacterium]